MISTLNPVSIVVPIKNRSSLLINLIKNLSNLDYPNYEIIIVDDCSNDNTKDILKNSPINSIILKKSVGSAEARNIGIKEAKNDIIALTDSDCFVSKNWLKDLVPYLKEYDVVGGKVKFYDNIENKFNPFNAKKEIILTKNSSINFLNTSNMIFKKEIWKTSDGFSNFRIEDLEFSWRLMKKGYKLIYSPKGLVIHHGKRTYFQNVLKYFHYGKSYSEIAFIHKMSFSYKTNKIFDRNSIFDFLSLISLPFLFLLILSFLNFIIINILLRISMDLISSFLCFYFMFRFIRRVDILFTICKSAIIFSIINFYLIYKLKSKK